MVGETWDSGDVGGSFHKLYYKDPYETSSMMESRRIFFVAHLFSLL